MTVIRAANQRGRSANRGHQRNPDLTDTWAWLTKPRSRAVKKSYRSRSSYDRTAQPLTERQRTILDLVGEEPVRAKALCHATGLSSSQIASALAALSARELVRRAGRGEWVRE